MASLVRLFDGAGAVQMKVIDLADRMGVSPRVVMRSVSKLSKADEYLVVKTVADGRGRPTRSYEISAKIRSRLEKVTDVSLPLACKEAVQHLLSAQKRSGEPKGEASTSKRARYKQPPVRKKSDQLTPANRWLLAVMISHASEFGVVRDLGLSSLRQLTGMSELRLKAQLLRLVELGFIRSYVPGVSSPLFAQTKVSTTYFLNLNHSGLGQGEGRHAVIVLQENLEDQLLVASVPAQPIVERFFRKLAREAINVLRIRIDGYVSVLLSTYWVELGQQKCPDLTPALLDMVSADFTRPAGTSVDAFDIDEYNWSLVIDHFCRLAIEQARGIRERLRLMPQGAMDSVPVQLVPAPRYGGAARFTTLLIGRSPVPRYNCLVFRHEPLKVCAVYSDEAELSVAKRCRFGLQSRPKGRE